MTDCDACTAARTSCSGLYRFSCTGCTARAIARSLAAFNALDPRGNGKANPLRETVAQMLPNVSTTEARRMVLEWWKHDHEQWKARSR